MKYVEIFTGREPVIRNSGGKGKIKQCFRNFVVGSGSAFSIRSSYHAMAGILKQFRDHILGKYEQLKSVQRDSNRLSILVAIQGKGGNIVVRDTSLCDKVKSCLLKLTNTVSLSRQFATAEVKCVLPEQLTFLEEVMAARKAHIIVSIDGTLSWISMFAQSKTQHVILSKKLKESQIQMFATHFQPLYVPRETLRYVPRAAIGC